MSDKDQEARELAERHYVVEEGVTEIIRLVDSAEAEVVPGSPIKLLEVNENTVPSGIMPIQFGPSPSSGLHYPAVIVEVTPEEYQKIRNDELKLPNGWKLGERFPRPVIGNGQ